MPNYNNNNTRDNSIDELPRMIFQLPNTDGGTALPSANPVFFCQSGCAIDYKFSNIRSCQFNNDGKKFTITPTDRTNINYIMWNGTDINSGEKMTQFTLKEVYFTAPAKDYLGINRDILTQSIQCYFVFVNEKYSNLMICVSVIGSVNNLGNAPKSNGFVMMETLATRIPSVNVQSQLNNLNNFNLGTLIPPNKPFFSTLITNNIQYIISTEVVDVPISFFSNISTMVNGGTQVYNAKMNQNITNIPQNPSTTILFYNENSQMLNDNQNFVCNSNCDLVPGKKITPSIGTLTTTQSTKKPARPPRTVSGGELPPEKCETKDVWENQPTKPKTVKDSSGGPSGPSGPSGTDSINGDKDNTPAIAITVSLLIAMVIIIIGCSYYKYKKYGFSIKLIVAGIIGIIVTVVGLSVGCHLYVEEKDLHWLSYVLGACGFFGAMVFIVIINNSDSYRYNTSYSSFNSEISPITNKQQPYSGITVPTGFNQPTSFFGKMGKMFSSSQNKPIDYSTQITVPPAQNTQSFFGRMFKKSPEQLSATVPESSVSVPSSMTVRQSSTSSATVPSSMTVRQSSTSSATVPSSMMAQSSASSATVPQSSASSATVSQSSAIASPQPSQSLFSKLKDKFSKKTGSTMSSAPSKISDPFINKVSRLITHIQTEPNSKISSNKKKSLINKLTRITQNPSNGAKILNEVNRELATYK
jgi:hypothetical protein